MSNKPHLPSLLFLKKKRITFSYDEKEYDITNYALQLTTQWFDQNNFHVTKGKDNDGVMKALMVTDKLEVIQFVQEAHSILENDFKPTFSKKEGELYQVKIYKE